MPVRQLLFIAALALAAPAVLLPAEAKRCQPDEIRYDTKTCYWADDNGGAGYTQPEAAEACHARGMEMTSIHSQAENDFITDFPTFTSAVWIGLSDEDGNDTYKWSDGTALDYVNWHASEPDGGDEYCVYLHPIFGVWSDYSCAPTMGVVCRGPPDYEPLE